MLQQADPEARVNLQGCDCINPATRFWKAESDPRNYYAGEIMVGFDDSTDRYLTRGFELLAEPPQSNPED